MTKDNNKRTPEERETISKSLGFTRFHEGHVRNSVDPSEMPPDARKAFQQAKDEHDAAKK